MDLPKLPRSKKRRDELVEAARTRVEVLKKVLVESEDALSALLVAMVLEERPGLVPEGVVIGSWDCPTSPVGVCAYDTSTDRCCDECLFCEEPSERR